MAQGKNSSSKKQTDNGNTEISLAKITLISTVAVALFTLVGTGISTYNSRRAAEAPVVIPLQATQTAESRLTALSNLPTSSVKSTITFMETASQFTSLETPTLAGTLTSTPATSTVFPTTSTKIIATSNNSSLGSLEVIVPEHCTGIPFNVIVGEQVMGSGYTGNETPIVQGEFDIIPVLPIKDLPIRHATIQAGEKTVVDFSKDFGTLLVKNHPKFNIWFYFDVFRDDTYVSGYSVSNQYNCIPVGIYDLYFPGGITQFPMDKVSIGKYEIKPGEDLIIGSDVWAKQFGVLSFSGNAVQLTYLMTNTQTGKQTQVTHYSTASVWLQTGKYQVLIQQPYIGLKFDVEIFSKEETVIPLP